MASTSTSPLSTVPAAVAWSLRVGCSASRGWSCTVAALYLTLGLLPAAQVVLVERVVAGLTATGSADWWAVLVLAGLVGMTYSLGQTALAGSQRLALRVRLHHQTVVLRAAAATDVRQWGDPGRIADLQAADEAAGVVDTVPGDVIRMMGMVVTAFGLCLAIARIEPVAGVLVVLALVPTLVAFTRITRVETAHWSTFAAAERRAAYTGEHLLQQRTATELATLGSAGKVVELAVGSRRRAMLVMDGMVGAAMRWESLSGLATAILLGAALVLVVGSGSSAAGAAAALTGTLAGLQAMRSAGYAAGGILSAAPKVALLQDLDIVRCPQQQVVADTTEIRADGLSVVYPDGFQALRGVSLSAVRGEMIALVGVNGAGKTTLVNALMGIVPLETGTVSIDGIDTDGWASDRRLERFGLLTQEFGRPEFTVRDVVGLGLPGDVTDAAIRDAIRSAQADPVVARLEDGLDGQLGEQWGGTGLSGGQWQRLALARIHLRAAGIWILDEPTSAIDAEAEEAIFAELRRRRAERITIVVSHRAWTLREVDRIYVLDAGAVVQQGTFAELIVRPGRFAELFAGQRLDPS